MSPTQVKGIFSFYTFYGVLVYSLGETCRKTKGDLQETGGCFKLQSKPDSKGNYFVNLKRLFVVLHVSPFLRYRLKKFRRF